MTAFNIVEDIIETYEVRSESDVMSSVIAVYTLSLIHISEPTRP